MLAERVMEPVSSQPSIQTKRWHHEILYWLQDVKRPYHWCSTTSPCNTPDLERTGTGENFLNYRSGERLLANTAPARLKKIYSLRHSGWRAISIPSDAIRIEECTLYIPEYNEGSPGYFLEKICRNTDSSSIKQHQAVQT